MDFASAVSWACNQEGSSERLDYIRGLASKAAVKPGQTGKAAGFTIAGLDRARLRTLDCFGNHVVRLESEPHSVVSMVGCFCLTASNCRISQKPSVQKSFLKRRQYDNKKRAAAAKQNTLKLALLAYLSIVEVVCFWKIFPVNQSYKPTAGSPDHILKNDWATCLPTASVTARVMT